MAEEGITVVSAASLTVEIPAVATHPEAEAARTTRALMLAERVRMRHTAHRTHRRRTTVAVVKPTAAAVMLVEETTNNPDPASNGGAFSAPPFSTLPAGENISAADPLHSILVSCLALSYATGAAAFVV